MNRGLPKGHAIRNQVSIETKHFELAISEVVSEGYQTDRFGETFVQKIITFQLGGTQQKKSFRLEAIPFTLQHSNHDRFSKLCF